jgi:3',5'-cyclic AMP phosphodiesterase CpdA
MRRIAHLSDLHFGTEDPPVVEGLLVDLQRVQPHLIVVTGDLTQRARGREFLKARKFLDALDARALVVPGNHDIPLYNLMARFGWPLASYRQYITADLQPTFADAELSVAGVNTARSDVWKDGRMSLKDIERLRTFYNSQPQHAFKILAAHHPFIPPVRDPSAALVGRAAEALRMLAACGCHLILAGHLHHAYAGDVRPHHVEIERSMLVVQAGTAVSHRRRGEANAYNLLEIEGSHLRLEVRAFSGVEFVPTAVDRYSFESGEWMLIAETRAELETPTRDRRLY